jgi:ATP-binding cassette subfamily B multidrug efflux pump
VDNLSFSYGDRKILEDVSASVPAGSKLAIVGRTGSGKSTFASLLPRLLKTPPHSVFLDGDDITKVSLRSLRKTIGYAPQESFLFSTTVARNIGYSLDDPDSAAAHERIREAAREACVLDEIEGMSDGFDTVVGERGVQLSGGQKQRIALARALLREPAVLVLDDPLSAVDAKTEARILEALARAGENRTLVLVTNRIVASKDANQILVFDKGRIVERGTHDDLVRAGGLYTELASKQRLEEELASL